MFGFGLKDKSKKLLNDHFDCEGYWTTSWLNSIVSQGKAQGYNEYDVVIWYWITDQGFLINTWKDHESQESKMDIYRGIQDTLSKIDEIKHLAHQDTGYQAKLDEISEASEILKTK
tara:strand:- start:6 stop:353 length:348 start_codon:yes stop_codon:yes gene_type:complete